jgi:chromosome segregation ATPase
MSVVPFATSSGSDPAPTDAADARQQILAVKRTLDEATSAVESLQGALAAQHELERLLKQGRTHLQDLQTRLQHAEEQREQYRAELVESRTAHQRDVEQLQRQRDEQTAAHTQFAEERGDERTTLTRLLNEAESKEREMIQERDALRQQIEALRAAGMRAQSLAREIIQAHENVDFPPARPPE